jgi:hypothetical protein
MVEPDHIPFQREPNPEWEAKAKAYRADKIADHSIEPEQTLKMLEQWTANAP